MKVVAFDLATKTGVAIGCAGEKPRAFSVDLGKGRRGDPTADAARFSKVLRMVAHFVKTEAPHLIAIEAPVGGRDASAFLIGLIACAEAEAHRHGIRVVKYFPSTVRKHFLGKALTGRDFPGLSHAAAKKAIKGRVIARCQLLGWPVEDGDSADACALWDFACATESRAHQMTSLPGMFEGAAE